MTDVTPLADAKNAQSAVSSTVCERYLHREVKLLTESLRAADFHNRNLRDQCLESDATIVSLRRELALVRLAAKVAGEKLRANPARNLTMIQVGLLVVVVAVAVLWCVVARDIWRVVM